MKLHQHHLIKSASLTWTGDYLNQTGYFYPVWLMWRKPCGPRMPGMPTQEEKVAFSRRLNLALRRSPESVQGPTELALRFNLRHPGSAISAQTAHKWLNGRAIPTADKLDTLAKWLNVSAHWLHYGPPPSTLHAAQPLAGYDVAREENPAPAQPALELARKIQSLPPERRYLIEELVDQLLPPRL